MSGSGAAGPSGVEAVIFDYGGVLTTPVRESIAAWLAADGIDPASFSRTLKRWLSRTADDGTPIHRIETGLLETADFERILARELVTLDGRPVPAQGLLARLFAGLRPEPDMVVLVSELRAAGVRVGLLSNSWGNTYPRAELDEAFDDVVISSEVGMRKPQPAIFGLALERLGVPADRTVFVDDADPNIEGAKAVGLIGVHHTDPAVTRAALATLVPGVTPPPTATTPSDHGMPEHGIPDHRIQDHRPEHRTTEESP